MHVSDGHVIVDYLLAPSFGAYFRPHAGKGDELNISPDRLRGTWYEHGRKVVAEAVPPRLAEHAQWILARLRALVPADIAPTLEERFVAGLPKL